MVSSTTTRLCLECMRIATTPPYTYKPMEFPYANKPQIDLGVQCSTILKAVFFNQYATPVPQQK